MLNSLAQIDKRSVGKNLNGFFFTTFSDKITGCKMTCFQNPKYIRCGRSFTVEGHFGRENDILSWKIIAYCHENFCENYEFTSNIGKMKGKVGAAGPAKASTLVCIPCKCAMVSEDDPVPAADEAAE